MEPTIVTEGKNKKHIQKIISRLKDDIIIVLCDCGGTDHHLWIMKDRNEKIPLYYIGIVPVRLSLWGRIKHAWKYIRGMIITDDIVLHQEQIEELAETLNKLKRNE